MIERSEPAQVRRDRDLARRDLPHVVGLLADALRSGQPPGRRAGRGRRRAARPGRGPAGRGGAAAAARAWTRSRSGPTWPPTRPSARSAGRWRGRTAPARPWCPPSNGSPTSWPASARAEVEDRARAVGVKAAVPLGLCLLPAFVLIGIVPVVAGLLTSLGALSAPRSMTTNRPQPTSPARGSPQPVPAPPPHRGSGPAEFESRPRRGHVHEGVPCTPHRSVPIRDERGITTAEYAVGTAAGAGLAGLLYKMLTGGFGDQLLKLLYDHVLGLLGIG